MAHLKTKATTSNLSEREQWKWNLSRLLYEKDYNKKEITDLYKVIDLMMTLSEDLQLKFENKLTQYEEERKMPLLTNIERRALQKGAKENCQENIFELLKIRFNFVPKSIENSLKNIDDLAFLKQLLISTISVKSLEEFEQLINS